MEAENILDVKKFVLACNDMLTGKFLDLNKRLDKFLSVMTKSEDIINLLSDCLEDFDDEQEFANAFSVDKKTGNVKVAIPVEDEKRLALFVTIFNNIINDKLNANQFLQTYFQDKKLTPMQNFLEKIIKPFRDTICKIFEIDINVSEDDIKEIPSENDLSEPQEEKLPHLEELFGEIKKNCNQILAILKFEKKRTDALDDIEFIIQAIFEACDKNDLMIVNGLVIGLNYASKKFRNIKHLMTDLNNLIFDYYDYLAGGEE